MNLNEIINTGLPELDQALIILIPWVGYGIVSYIFGIFILKMIEGERKKPIRNLYMISLILFMYPFAFVGMSNVFTMHGMEWKDQAFIFIGIIVIHVIRESMNSDLSEILYRTTKLKIFYDKNKDYEE